MKKILLLFIIMITCAHFCLAETTEGNNSATATDTKASTETTSNVDSNTNADSDPDSIENINNYFNDEEQTTELNGYAQYNEEEPAEEPAVYLENTAEGHGINFTGPKKVRSKALTKTPDLQPLQGGLQAASKFSTQEYDIRPVSTSYSRKFGQFSLGTAYNSSIDSARVGYSTSLFAKYEGKYFALTTGASKSTNNNYDDYSDKMFFAPELKLTKRLSLLNVMKTDVYQINKSSELVLRYSPHMKKYADDVQFEVGAGQTFHDDNAINSSLRFSTNFKL